MRTLAASTFVAALLAVPLAASAAAFDETTLQIRSLLTAMAVLKAEKENAPVACALMTSSQSVRAGEPFILAWSSFGADDPALNRWAPSGAYTVALRELGVWKYTFDFYGKDGKKTTCTTIMSVHR